MSYVILFYLCKQQHDDDFVDNYHYVHSICYQVVEGLNLALFKDA